MKCKIVKLDQFSGCSASVYSVYINDEKKTLFDKFIEENINSFKSELLNIIQRLKVIGKSTGARMKFFKDKEGNPGDGVCALYDIPGTKLRLYCIRYGAELIILGGGGEKPKHIKKLQDDKKLKKENYLLREISNEISNRIKTKDIEWSDDHMDLIGALEFNTEDYE
ncbi:MAG: hypothetical protein ACLFVR_00635 [Thiohalospira sp.]